MDRRQFLEQVAAWSAGFSLATPIFNVASVMAADVKPQENPLLTVAKGKEYGELVTRALKPLGGIAAFVKSGDRVVVKPNIGWDRKPEQAANTHPDVVKAIVEQCLAAGAKQVRVFDRTVNDARRSYNNSGILAAVESIKDPRSKCVFIDDKRFVPVKIVNGKSLDEFEFYQDALESACDCYINVPIAKHHQLSKLTLGLKNAMGVIGGNRGKIHKDLHQRIADLNLVIRPRLTIVDATRILLRNGPSGGKLEDVKVLDTVIASADPVAADAYATTLFGMKPEQVGSTIAGAKLGLGQMDLTKIRLVDA
mgnify:FL=1